MLTVMGMSMFIWHLYSPESSSLGRLSNSIDLHCFCICSPHAGTHLPSWCLCVHSFNLHDCNRHTRITIQRVLLKGKRLFWYYIMYIKGMLQTRQKYFYSKTAFYVIPVSYTHLDVYKRQVGLL